MAKPPANSETPKTDPQSGAELVNGCAQEPMLDHVIQRLNLAAKMTDEEINEYRTAQLIEDVPVPPGFLVSIVIPVFNEAATIASVIGRVAALPFNKQIVIVDDASDDGTREILQGLSGIDGLEVHFQNRNSGKGAALRAGFNVASGDVVIVQDADFEYDPKDIPGLLVPILQDEADVVYGSRFISEELQDRSWIHRMGNAVLTRASNVLSGLRLTDMETCYKAFRREALEVIEVEENRFGVEPELTAKLAREGFRFCEVPISYNARTYADGKKIGIRDLFKAFYCIGKYSIGR